MARARSREVIEPLQLKVAIGHLERDWPTERDAPPNAAQNVDGIRLDPLPPATAVATLPSPQFHIDWLDIDRHAGGKPIDEGYEGFTVRFTSGQITKHAWKTETGFRMQRSEKIR